jgi:hypothetical protein
MKHLRLVLTRLAVRVVTIGLAVGLLYALVLLERFVLAVLPAGASAWWVDHPNVQPIVDIPIALGAMVAVFITGNWALTKLGVSSTETHDAQRRTRR